MDGSRRDALTPQAATLLLLAGVLLVQWLPRLWPVPLSLGLLLLASLGGWLGGYWLRWPALLLASICWAAAWGQAGMDARWPRAWEGHEIDVIAEVTGLPLARPEATTFLMQVRSLPGMPHWRGRVRVSWYRAPVIRPCQRWRLRLRLRRPRGTVNPGPADSERSALEHGLHAVGYVRAPDWARLQGRGRCVDGVRDMLARGIDRALPGRHAAALLKAFAVGDVRGLSEADWSVARANGIPHLIAISGFHVGMAGWFGALLVLGLYRCLPRLGLYVPRPLAWRAAVLLWAGVYCALAGFGIPCVRTLLMMAAVMLHQGLRRTSWASTGLLLALAIVLLCDPLACLAAGFWLSFVGVGLLMYGLQEHQHGLLGWLREITLGQWLMTASMLPLTLWFFGEASWVGALSNVLAVPWISFVVIPLVLLSLPLLGLGLPLAAWVLWLAAGATDGLWWLLQRLGQWPGAHWQPPMPGLASLVLATLGVIWLWMPRGVPLRWSGLLLLSPLLWPPVVRPPLGGLRIWALDVGQGLAVLVETHRHLMLFDAGPRYPSGYDLGAAVVLPAIYASGAGPLDRLMISHGDNDHAGGALAVATAFPAARRSSGEPARMRYASSRCHRGQAWQWDGVSFTVLWPPDDGQDAGPRGAGNSRSCVVQIRGAGGGVLLTGDIGRAQEQALAPQLQRLPPMLLQVPHHGSRSASSAALLDGLQPRSGWVSSGWRNPFGHPHPVVMARYRARGIPIWNTADSGALIFELPPAAAPTLTTRWRLRQRRYWRE